MSTNVHFMKYNSYFNARPHWRSLHACGSAGFDFLFDFSVNAGIKYDAEKEDRQLQEARQRELQRIEETKQKAAEKGAVNHLSLLWFYIETGSAVCEFAFGFLYSENPKAEKQDTFVEKLVTQVIKNLQVKISNIHVRYEDDVSTFDICVLSNSSAWSFYILKPVL